MDTGKTFKKYLSDSNPRDLIREIKIRPGIYDKDKLEQPRREHKQQLWMEVAESLTPTDVWESYQEEDQEARVDEVQHKWKHLRNHFLREVKLIESGQSHTKRKYIYYNDMAFMKPFVGIKMGRTTTKQKVKLSDSMDDSDRDTTEENDDADETMEYTFKSNESFEQVQLKSPIEERKSPPRRSVKAPTRKAGQEFTSTPKPKEPSLTREQKLVINKFDGLRKVSQKSRSIPTPAITQVRNPIPSISMRDGDISFCLSLVPTMRKLEESKRLKAKIEILTILHKYVEPERKKRVLASRAETNHTNDEDMSDNLFDVETCGSLKHEETVKGSNENTNNAWWT